jgi:hypothetical protein
MIIYCRFLNVAFLIALQIFAIVFVVILVSSYSLLNLEDGPNIQFKN